MAIDHFTLKILEKTFINKEHIIIDKEIAFFVQGVFDLNSVKMYTDDGELIVNIRHKEKIIISVENTDN